MLDNKELFLNSTILVIDDDEDSIELLKRLLSKIGCDRVLATSLPAEGISFYLDNTPDLVLLDMHMPNINGLEFMAKCRSLDPEGDSVPIIVLTGDKNESVRRQALECGANDFIDKMTEDYEVILRIRNQLKSRHLYLQVQKHNLKLEFQVFNRTEELLAAQEDVVKRLAMAAEYRDDQAGNHIEHVGNLSAELASVLGLETKRVELLRRSAKLHDIGKIGIPDRILYKPGPLTEEERIEMQTHTVIGSQILDNGTSELIQTAKIIARSHHERWDGKGYPDRLMKADIPIEGRIVAVVDVFDALMTKRPYKEAYDCNTAREIVLKEAGSHFDPEVVGAFSNIPHKRLIDICCDEHQSRSDS